MKDDPFHSVLPPPLFRCCLTHLTKPSPCPFPPTVRYVPAQCVHQQLPGIAPLRIVPCLCGAPVSNPRCSYFLPLPATASPHSRKFSLTLNGFFSSRISFFFFQLHLDHQRARAIPGIDSQWGTQRIRTSVDPWLLGIHAVASRPVR